MMKHFILLFSIFVLQFQPQAQAADLILMVIDNNSFLANQAVADLDIGVDTEVISAGELARGGEALHDKIDRAKVIIVDVMGRELEEYLSSKINLNNKKIYALRGSVDDKRLKKLGFSFDDTVAGYYRHVSKENIRNMLRLAANRHFDNAVTYSGVQKKPELGIYHPQSDKIFTDTAAYQQWEQQRDRFNPARPRIGLLFFSSFLTPGQQKPIRVIINRLEAEGFNLLPCFGRDQQTIERFLLDENGRARVELVLAFSLKFYSALTPALAADLRRLDVPIISAINLYKNTIDQWRASPIGIGGNEVAWSVATPEISGLIEPTPLSAKNQVIDPDSGKTYYISESIEENLQRLIPRLHNWTRLQRMDNKDKKIAIMFYNHHQGKQNIGASYLNVFASLQEILTAMQRDGYFAGTPPSQKEIKKLILTSARNIGSWAPGELDKMMASAQIVRMPSAAYKKWFSLLPADFQKNVIAQWGVPDSSKIMKDGDDFIIPAVTVNNLMLLPEPSRGWGDEPMKLCHDTTLFPHHQYLAVYLWLKHGFKADAMIHLGTHSTYEWTPGKQAGLSPSCSPEVLIGDIPNIYPYIVDDVGEGIQAKRRGRGVIISHLTPMLKASGLYEEYSRMAELANEYERARARGSRTAPEKFKSLMALAKETGILADIESGKTAQHDHYHKVSHDAAEPDHDHSHADHDHNHEHEAVHDHDSGQDQINDDQVHLLSHYLEDIRANLMPYGMHRFGKSPGSGEADDMAKAVAEWNPGIKIFTVTDRISQSGKAEMDALLAGLKGRYVRPGEGNDPIRNPLALPTGRNFYGFNPHKIPSPAAWELGKKAAREIIRNHLNAHNKYPDKVAVVLWATETLRNEGVNESTILYLMGIKPKWLKSGRVTGVEVIPGKTLSRPRIDVMINASGLYRDMFPDKLEFIDRAVQSAVRQTDIENLLLSNSAKMKMKLLNSGASEKEAEELSRLRIFSEEPGSYGTGLGQMASSSGIWETEKEVADVFENRMGFAFGLGRWGTPARQLLKENLADVDVAIHSRSSNIFGLLDSDDMFQYLGGLSMAVRLESGATPETLITQQQKPGQVQVEDVAKTIGREMRSRYLNPKWIEGMKKEDYAGAREMAHFAEYLWGWNMTNPEKIDAAKWEQTYAVYVEDKYGLDLKQFFNTASPWAYQSITGRMLETVRKGYWQADEAIQKKLGAEYALSVVQKGVACCDHTCNNPLLNQMVVSIISLPGVMNPEMVEKFKLAVEQAAKKSLAEQVANRKDLQQRLTSPAREPSGEPAEKQRKSKDGSQTEANAETQVEGYKMEKMKNSDDTTQVTSSGVEWLAGLAVIFIIGLAVYGAMRKKNYE